MHLTIDFEPRRPNPDEVSCRPHLPR
jgi:hypothetical protein